jgi:hypothetical protein
MAEISERTAALNTQMRFGNYREALVKAYSLRLDLQLSHPMTSKIHQELESVESVIENLERLRVSKYQRWATRFWESIVESFQPPGSSAAAVEPEASSDSGAERSHEPSPRDVTMPASTRPESSYLGGNDSEPIETHLLGGNP